MTNRGGDGAGEAAIVLNDGPASRQATAGRDLTPKRVENYSLLSQGDRAYLEEVGAAADAYSASSKSDATAKAYRCDMRDFELWAAPLQLATLPAAPDTVRAYLASLVADGRKASTINRRKAAIAWHHRQAGLESPTTSEAVRGTLSGIRRTIGTASSQKAAATDDVVVRLLREIPAGTLKGKRDRALILIGFGGALRRSELVGLDVSDIARQTGGIVVHLRRSKTDQEGLGQQVPIPTGSHLRPVRALDDWLAASGITTGPIFSRVDKADRLLDARLTPQSVAHIIKGYADAAGLDPAEFAGHSLRAGYVTTVLEKGGDLCAAADQARHAKLETTRIYDRRRKLFRNHAGSRFL